MTCCTMQRSVVIGGGRIVVSTYRIARTKALPFQGGLEDSDEPPCHLDETFLGNDSRRLAGSALRERLELYAIGQARARRGCPCGDVGRHSCRCPCGGSIELIGRKLFPQLRKNVVCDVGGHQRDNPGGASAVYFLNQIGRNA